MRKREGPREACAWPVPQDIGIGPLRLRGAKGRAGAQSRGSHTPSDHRPVLLLGSQSIQPAAPWAKPWVPPAPQLTSRSPFTLSLCWVS